MDSKEYLQSEFKKLISDMPWLQKLKDSQLLAAFGRMVGWAVRRVQFQAERYFQENFLSTAINAASIYAHASDRGYVPRKRQPSTGPLALTNSGHAQAILPIESPLTDENGRYYLLKDATSIAPGASQQVQIEQLKKTTYSFTVSAETTFYSILLPKDVSAQVSRIKVFVTESGTRSEWQKKAKFRNTTGSDQVYDEFFKHTEQLGVRFGNGQFGKIPSYGSLIEIEAYLTDGETTLLTGQSLEFVDGAAAFAETVSAVTAGAIDGGSERESVEEIKEQAQYAELNNGEQVWDSDYAFHLRSKVPGISGIRVWGEQDQEAVTGYDVDNIGRIWISAHSATRTQVDLQTDIVAAMALLPQMNTRPTYQAPVFVPYTVTVTAEVGRDKVLSEVEQAIRDALSVYGLYAAERPARVRTKDYFTLVSGTGFFDESVADFDLSLTGQTEAVNLNELVYLDLDASTIAVTYA